MRQRSIGCRKTDKQRPARRGKSAKLRDLFAPSMDMSGASADSLPRSEDDMISTPFEPRHPQAAGSQQIERFPLNTVCEAAKILTGASDPIAAMPSVLNVLSSFMGLRMGTLALLDDKSRTAGDGKPVNPFVIAATTHGATCAPPEIRALPIRATRQVFRTGLAQCPRRIGRGRNPARGAA
ncbi:hypothetical protein [Rhodovulum sp.]|uniref:hypothetical protein n=1 Tax=Rhodovulum sp. TaxID=34009 RepID=UPI00257B3E64|nr:hypothetical protein [Rhodovulum sp.]